MERKVTLLEARIEAGRPKPVEMPRDLPSIYRAHIDNLAQTLSREGVSGRAMDQLREQMDRPVVRIEPDAGRHGIEIFGNLGDDAEVCGHKKRRVL